MTKEPIRVFIGYDPNESSAYHVLSHSIHRYASQPVSITPIKLSELKETYTRPRDQFHSTEFSLSRFLTPYLCGYRGWAIFMDTDMLVRSDIAELFALRDSKYAVMVAKHDYTPRTETKMLGSAQTKYPKKNWSSVMLMNTSRCFELTPEYVNSASGLELHQFKWLVSGKEIGSLPLEWNWLVGEYDHNPKADLVHYTLGGPWWDDYFCCDYADDWRNMLTHALNESGNQSAQTTTSVPTDPRTAATSGLTQARASDDDILRAARAGAYQAIYGEDERVASD